MNRSSVKRAAAGLAALAISGAGLIALAPPASAAEVAATLAVDTPEPVILNAANQEGSDLSVTLGAAAVATDTIDIRVDPNTTDCSTDAEAAAGISFSAAVDNNANVTTSLVDECAGGVQTNVLRLTFTGAVANGTVIELTDVQYNVSATAPTGKVRLTLNGNAIQPGNAIVAKVDRLEGATRYHTAGAIAEAQNDCEDNVTIVSGQNFPDALAASFYGDPILLVEPNAVPAATKAALDGLGAKNVRIVGGTTAVSSAVATTLQGYDETACGDPAAGKLSVIRVSGATRYSTALAVATSAAAGTMDNGLSSNGGCTAVKTAIVVSGQNFPDALAAGTLASNGVNTGICGDGNNIPLILTTPGDLSPEAAEALNTLGAVQVIIVGGTQAVSDAAEADIDALASVTNVERIAGATRTETARDFAEMLADDYGGHFNTSRVLVATGANFPDALAAGPLGGLRFAPILLSTNATTLGAPAADFIEDTDSVLHATLLGGTTALNSAVQTAVGAAFLARN